MPRTKKAALKCPQCGQRFAMAMHLGRHMTTKHGQAPKKPAKTPKPARAARIARSSPQATPVASGLAEQLGSLVDRLQTERQEHVMALAEIDAVLARFGIQPQLAKRRGRPPKVQAEAAGLVIGAPAVLKKGRRRKRRKFAIPAHESVLQFVKSAGKAGKTSGEIGKHWKVEGRSGQPFITLGQLTKAKKLKKEDLKGQRGSRYTAG